ncbi:MAG: multicopper oxidase domain-containing protein [Pseudomonadota bacterium]
MALGPLIGAFLLAAGLTAAAAVAMAQPHHANAPDGMVMNANAERLPRGCRTVREEVAVTVRAGRRHAADIPGAVFAMDRPELRVPRCSRVTVTFVNDDQVRHQWMVHGLPRYLYPAGMFHIETDGGSRRTGTFIVPAAHRTYLIHCDLAQHMEKGMRGQLVVGRGSGDLWAVPGISDPFYRAGYLPDWTAWSLAGLALVGAGIGVRLHRRVMREDRW